MRFARKRKRIHEIAPDEIFLDSSNLPDHESSQFEGRVVPSLSRRSIFGFGVVFAAVAIIFGGRAFALQVAQGPTFAEISRDNTLVSSIAFATRGLIIDRNGKEIAWNEAQPQTIDGTSATSTYALRKYTELPGFSNLIGFVQYPKADQTGTWWREDYTGMAGIELVYNASLEGVNGSTMVETDARKKVERENIVSPPQSGSDLKLSIDANLQSELYKVLTSGAQVDGFVGGAGVIMDVSTGQLLAITSFPQYDNQAFTDGNSAMVHADLNDSATPLLDRAISGLYAPGSIVKPIFAAGALDAGIVTPQTVIVSTGAISVPNQFDPTHPSVFHDWTVHGPIDMETAIAVSSDEYFYQIGGGYHDQKGLGISNLDKYAAMFGLGTTTGINLPGEVAGNIPSPQWKANVFPGEPWFLGDTYHTAIGQYGFQITPLQAVRYASAIGNGGKLLTPQLLASSTPQFTQIPIPDSDLAVVRAGMRLAVTSSRKDATDNVMNIPGIDIAGKTGTAQIGAHNQWVNSWAIGFWPAENPKYAFAVVLEKGPSTETFNAADSVAPFFSWLVANHPEYAN
jgi:penicillin-binding protein 2